MLHPSRRNRVRPFCTECSSLRPRLSSVCHKCRRRSSWLFTPAAGTPKSQLGLLWVDHAEHRRNIHSEFAPQPDLGDLQSRRDARRRISPEGTAEISQRWSAGPPKVELGHANGRWTSAWRTGRLIPLQKQFEVACGSRFFTRRRDGHTVAGQFPTCILRKRC